jgi:hypothetical protein
MRSLSLSHSQQTQHQTASNHTQLTSITIFITNDGIVFKKLVQHKSAILQHLFITRQDIMIVSKLSVLGKVLQRV